MEIRDPKTFFEIMKGILIHSTIDKDLAITALT